jgi:hypothetical protein
MDCLSWRPVSSREKPAGVNRRAACPVALYPATSDSEKISFNQIRKTGHRIKYAKVDADTGEEVANEDIMKGCKVDNDTPDFLGTINPARALGWQVERECRKWVNYSTR